MVDIHSDTDTMTVYTIYEVNNEPSVSFGLHVRNYLYIPANTAVNEE